MSFIFRDRKDEDFSYGNNEDFGQMRRMKYPQFSMCIHFRDTDFCQKMLFELKSLALDWFESFKQTNKRPVTITFYCGVTPYWVYRYEKSDS